MKEKQVPSEEEGTQRQYTAAEMEQMRKDTVKFYKDKNEVLTLQLKHENLLADIEESQLRQLVALSRKMQMMAPEGPGAPAPTGDTMGDTPVDGGPKPAEKKKPEPKKKRELKKD